MILALSIPSYAVMLGAVLGMSTGLLAVGLVLVYKSSRVLNFAQGQLGVMAAVLLARLVTQTHVPYWPAVVFCLVVAAAVGAACELLLRRLFDRPRLVVMVATIGLTQILYLVTLLPFVRPRVLFFAYPVPIHSGFVLGGFPFHGDTVLALIVAPLVAFGLAVFFTRSPHGLAMRAMAENADSARLAGVRVRWTSMLAWAMAGVLSAIAAILASPAKGNAFTQGLGPDLLLRALTAALIGGMTNMPVAFAAGISIGVVEELLDVNFHNNSASVQAALFALLLVVLLVRVGKLRGGARDEERSSWLTGGRKRDRSEQGQVDLIRRRIRVGGLSSAFAVAVLLPAVIDQSRAFLVSGMFVFAVVALSLTVLTGWAGQLSLGQFGLVGVGALVAVHLSAHWPLPLVFLIAGLIAALIAVVIGLPALRIRGLYLAVTTLGFALVMQTSVISTSCWRAPLVGWHVCSGLPDPTSTLLAPVSLFGLSLDTQRALYYVAFAQLVLFLAAARLWRDHGLARLLVAVRDNEAAAGAAGVRVVRAKLTAFALSGFMAGSAGVTFALIEQRLKAGLFSVDQSILVISMVVIGGLGSVEGAVLGAAYLVGLPAAFGHGTTVTFLCSGIGLLVFVLYLPGGLADLVSRAGDRLVAGLAGLRRRPPPGLPISPQPSDPTRVLVEVGP